MKNTRRIVLCAAAAAILCSGCGKNTDSTGKDSSGTSSTPETAAVSAPSNGSDAASPSSSVSQNQDDAPLSSPFYVENASKYITLGSFEDLSVEKIVYEVSEDDIDLEVANHIQSMTDYQESSEPADYDDVVSLELTITPDGGKEEHFDDYALQIGIEDLGTGFDQALLGKKPGDTVEVTTHFEQDTWHEDWIDKDVTFSAKVLSILSPHYPELTDAYVKENLGYDSIQAYRDAIRTSMQHANEANSEQDAITSLLVDAMDNSTYSGHPESLYNICAEKRRTMYESFAQSMGMTLDQYFHEYKMTNEDLEDEIMYDVRQSLLISAICQQENLVLDKKLYQDYLNEYYSIYGYDDPSVLQAYVGSDTLIWDAWRSLAGHFLLKKAAVEEIDGSIFLLDSSDEGSYEFETFSLDDIEIIYEDEEESNSETNR